MFETGAALAADDGVVMTCAGMGATVDMMLSIAALHLSSAAMMTVADVLLHERIRHFNTLQPYAGRAVHATGDDDLDVCVGLMHSVQYRGAVAHRDNRNAGQGVKVVVRAEISQDHADHTKWILPRIATGARQQLVVEHQHDHSRDWSCDGFF